MKVALVDGDDPYRIATFAHREESASQLLLASSSSNTPPCRQEQSCGLLRLLELRPTFVEELNTSTQPCQRQTSHVFAIVTSASRIIIAATRLLSDMLFLHRDDAVLSFTNCAALSVEPVEPFADQLDRITTIEELNRNPPVQAAVDVERRAELSKEVLRM